MMKIGTAYKKGTGVYLHRHLKQPQECGLQAVHSLRSKRRLRKQPRARQ